MIEQTRIAPGNGIIVLFSHLSLSVYNHAPRCAYVNISVLSNIIIDFSRIIIVIIPVITSNNTIIVTVRKLPKYAAMLLCNQTSKLEP